MLDAFRGCRFWMISRGIFVAASVTLLFACGGGGGGGGSLPAMSSSSSTSTQLSVDAGPDITVVSGYRVDLDPKVMVIGANSYTFENDVLEVKGSSSNLADIVKIQWIRVEGPEIILGADKTNPGKAYFYAPGVKRGTEQKVLYKLKIENAGGKSAEDLLAITIRPPNIQPVAILGVDLEVKEGEEVVLDGSLSEDEDGHINQFIWRQLSGVDIQLSHDNTNTATFTAPAVEVETEFEFELVVVDNEGEQSSDRIKVSVVPKSAPEISLYFPPKIGSYDHNTLSAYGSVKTIDSEVESVTVSFGDSVVTAIVNKDGSWRADNITVPKTSDFTLSIRAVDTKGRIGIESAKLSKGLRGYLGGGWGSLKLGMAVDSKRENIYFFGNGVNESSLSLMAFNLRSTERTVVSDFADVNKGINPLDLYSMTYNESLQKVFATVKPEDATKPRQIISIDVSTGERKLVSGESYGVEMSTPYDIKSMNDGSLFISDLTSNIIKVDAQGNRSIAVDLRNVSGGVWYGPAALSFDPSDINHELYIAVDAYLSTEVIKLSLDTFTLTPVYLNYPIGKPIALAYNAQTRKLFVVSFSGNLIKVDLSGNNASAQLVGELPAYGLKLSFDYSRNVLYALTEIGLLAIDPTTGHMAGIGVKY